ncbi:malto-oligosyltrehalose trehalohydrolase [Vulcaniibacterium thermophilum]|uniref:Malto-oligosyltrehalose trehalohydrolase n=1 Tax=Vulcaniibacterium thermophilum TaxID=1169913 RepID=A0A918Z962_9GAMM|nr:malto-oligosyltrehalose trehalohydrolase [Vulcaniibacterium thermophilum]GHE42129.1 malto-oligosyltrehalose trehalohydrolase [Vulcaniibacterium thermophilum]
MAATQGFGAVPLDARNTRFRLWAPDARAVAVELPHARVPMTRGADGSFEAIAEAPPGTRYRFRIDDRLSVPDPASRWQPDGVHGDSVVLDTARHRWRCAHWRGRPWREAVICELHVGACGGYRGVMAQLPQLARWGITAIELMPLAQFPGTRNWGYDGVYPYAPAAAYGTPEELKALVDAAHAHGLMVLLDVVYNHFGPDGNYLGEYAKGFFRDDIATPWGAAIDFRQPAVKRFFIDNALMWLRDYRFDGLRLDAVHAIRPGAFLRELREAVERATPGRHVHLVLENEANEASLLAHGTRRGFRAQWADDFHNALHVLLTGEHEGYYGDYAGDPARKLARALGEGFAFQGERTRAGHRRGEPSAMLPPHAFVVFAQNHDQIGNRAFGERLRALVPPRALRAALALTALTPMIPLFFMGEPWGCARPFLFFTDHAPPLDEAVREGRRREFAAFAAFADPQRRARIPDPNAEATFRASCPDIAEAARGEGAAWAVWFASLLAKRREAIVPHLDRARPLGARAIGTRAVRASWSLDAGGRLHLAANFAHRALALDAPLPGRVLHAEPADAAGCGEGLPPQSLLVTLEQA